MASAAIPWNLEGITRRACEQLCLAAKTPYAYEDLIACDVLLWQRVADKDPQPVELAVACVEFLLPDKNRCWALVELSRVHGEPSWRGEDHIDDDVRNYVRAMTQRGYDPHKSVQNELSRRCQCYSERPDNADVLNFLSLCSFFNPWVAGVQEVWDTVEDRVINWSGWMQRLGWEPSAEIVRQLGRHRVI